jgi:hypothetical protein
VRMILSEDFLLQKFIVIEKIKICHGGNKYDN